MSTEDEKPAFITGDKGIGGSGPLSAKDEEILKSLTEDGAREGYVVLTPDTLQAIMDGLSERKKAWDQTMPELVKLCPPEMRLAVTCWVMEKIVAHATEGGTFRYLIYDRLGFGPEAYLPIQWAGGLTISNEFDLREKVEDPPEVAAFDGWFDCSVEGSAWQVRFRPLRHGVNEHQHRARGTTKWMPGPAPGDA